MGVSPLPLGSVWGYWGVYGGFPTPIGGSRGSDAFKNHLSNNLGSRKTKFLKKNINNFH